MAAPPPRRPRGTDETADPGPAPGRPRLVGELTDQLGLTQPGTSKHLRVLREAGLVRVRRDAQRRGTSCARPLVEVDAWLEKYRRLWADHLDALERHLDTMPDEPDTQRQPDGRTGERDAEHRGRPLGAACRAAAAHPPEKVLRALTEPAHLGQWFPSDVELDLTVGGKVGLRPPPRRGPEPRRRRHRARPAPGPRLHLGRQPAALGAAPGGRAAADPRPDLRRPARRGQLRRRLELSSTPWTRHCRPARRGPRRLGRAHQAFVESFGLQEGTSEITDGGCAGAVRTAADQAGRRRVGRLRGAGTSGDG